MEVKKITEGMTAPQVAQVIDDNFKGIIGETDAKLSELGSEVVELSFKTEGASARNFVAKICSYYDDAVAKNRHHLRLFLKVDGACHVSFTSGKYYVSSIGIVKSISDGMNPSNNVPWVEQINGDAVQSFFGKTSQSGYLMMSVREEDSTKQMTESVVEEIIGEIKVSAVIESGLLNIIDSIDKRTEELGLISDSLRSKMDGFNIHDFTLKIFTYMDGDDGISGNKRYHLRLFLKVDNSCRVSFLSEKYYVSSIGIVKSISDGMNPSNNVPWVEQINGDAVQSFFGKTSQSGYLMMSVREEDSTKQMTESVVEEIIGEIKVSAVIESGLSKEIDSEKDNISTMKILNIDKNDISLYNDKTRGLLQISSKEDVAYTIKFKSESVYRVGISGYNGRDTVDLSKYNLSATGKVVYGQYEFISIFFKHKDDEQIILDDLISDLEINEVSYVPDALVLNSKDTLYPIYNILSSNNDTYTDYLAVPVQNASLKFHLPKNVLVQFQYGSRNIIGVTEIFKGGDRFELTDEMVAIKIFFKTIDGRVIGSSRVMKMYGQEMGIIIEGVPQSSIIERNVDCEKYCRALMAIPSITIANYRRLPIIVHTSDIHGDAVRMNSALDYADYIGADAFVNTGDTCVYELSNSVSFNESIAKSHKTEYINVVGNHDTYGTNVYANNILPFADKYQYKDMQGLVTSKTYYVKDISEAKLRFIVLDAYESLTYAAYMARMSKEQMDFFVNALLSTPDDWGIIVAIHQVPHKLIKIEGKENFISSNMDDEQVALDSSYMKYNPLTGNPLAKIVDAFIRRVDISDSYSHRGLDGTTETINYSYSFVNRNNAEFIAFLNGHAHLDYIGRVSDVESLEINLNIASCSAVKSRVDTVFSANYDCERGTVGSNQDAFNVYMIDRENKRIGIARIGANMSYELVDRKAMWVNYQ